MIYRIAEPPPGGKGLVGIYPEWDGTGDEEALILSRTRADHFSILFTRNYISHFFRRISYHLQRYGGMVDIVCGWEIEKIRMFFIPYNPAVEVFPLSAVHFNTFGLLQSIRQRVSAGQITKENDLFFAVSERPDGLKNTPLLVSLLSRTENHLKVTGYGRVNESDLEEIRGNPNLYFTWRGKASVTDPAERQAFLTDLASSRLLLVTSKAEGYSRLIGEALYLGVPVLLFADILCENWFHLNSRNCRLFIESTFEPCLKDMLSRRWEFTPPDYEDGNRLLKRLFIDFLSRRGLPEPVTWYPLQYGARNDKVISRENQ